MLRWRYLLAGSAVALALISAEGLYIKHLWGVIGGKNTALERAASALRMAAAAIGERDAKIIANADHERADASETSTFWKGQTRAAYDAGYAAHRCPGEPISVQHDLRTVWEAGAFRPGSGPVPGKPDGDR